MKHPTMPCMTAMASVVSPRPQGGEELPKAMLLFLALPLAGKILPSPLV
jgi:hypothetical protein